METGREVAISYTISKDVAPTLRWSQPRRLVQRRCVGSRFAPTAVGRWTACLAVPDGPLVMQLGAVLDGRKVQWIPAGLSCRVNASAIYGCGVPRRLRTAALSSRVCR